MSSQKKQTSLQQNFKTGKETNTTLSSLEVRWPTSTNLPRKQTTSDVSRPSLPKTGVPWRSSGARRRSVAFGGWSVAGISLVWVVVRKRALAAVFFLVVCWANSWRWREKNLDSIAAFILIDVLLCFLQDQENFLARVAALIRPFVQN